MSRVTRQQFSKSRPTLKAEDLQGGTATVVTIGSVEEIELDEQPKLVLGFDEWPEHSYFPNVTSIGNLIEILGDETDDWKGKRVALIVVNTNNPNTKKTVKALWVAPADEQDAILRPSRGRGGRRPAPVARVAKKATRGRKAAR